MRGSPPTVGGSFSVNSGSSFSVGKTGQSLPGIVSVSGGVTPETMTGLPTLAPVISVQPRLCSDSPGRDIVEGCLLTPGTRPNSLSPSRFSTTVAVTNGCDNTPLGDPGRAYGQPVVKAASPAPAMAMVWAADNSAQPIGEAARGGEAGCPILGSSIPTMAKWHAMVTQMQHKVGTARRIWAREFARHSAESVRAPQARRLEPAPEAHWEPQGTPDHSDRTRFIKRASRTRTRFNRSISIL